ncbi:unnamed protein product [Vitrella brassicaformis CCMP3155]|uniref:Transcription elongation factor n=2 Tax=Vitrella brassicaformis TaxID=1169539 RepID=A0A0G4EJN3_VITBC|nr:unnamed protein product [Vitrella brassicaformis CCMP3155]|mmetsp:Transcript_19812/g.48048  ORF Transcript_19812/g.48048 Transcript_19812/m.48048 type:complete len:381 (+) Transcript_19812:112-1254(+)|eukprot:CEL96751.1 unnamed protein product [Vitrella brassicaformis CCMP3155]
MADLELEDALRAKKRLEDKSKPLDTADLLAVLRQLEKINMTLATLRTTKIGKTVNALKQHHDPDVKRLSAKLVVAWKKVADAGKSSGASAVAKGAASAVAVAAAAGGGPALSPSGLSDSSPSPNHQPLPNGVPVPPRQPDRQRSQPSSASSGGIGDAFNEYPGERCGQHDRDKARAKLWKALWEGCPEHVRSGTREEAAQVAASIERCVYERFFQCQEIERLQQELSAMQQLHANAIAPNPKHDELMRKLDSHREEAARAQKPYLNQLKVINFNFADVKNFELNARVLYGDITPEKLARMSSQDMASNDKKAERDKHRQEAAEAAESDWHMRNLVQASGTFQCFKCKKRRTTFFQLQTRSSDEPMTTFVTCLECSNRWKF